MKDGTPAIGWALRGGRGPTTDHHESQGHEGRGQVLSQGETRKAERPQYACGYVGVLDLKRIVLRVS